MPSLERSLRVVGASSKRRVVLYFSTKLVICRLICKRGYYVFYRMDTSIVSGGHQPMKANVRLIAATHQNLEERVRDGVFREDLFHRLNVIRLRVPSLRERREDIPFACETLLAAEREATGCGC